MVSLQKWKEVRPCLIDNMLATLDPQSHRVCQCGKQVVVRCLDCLPLPFLCADCDIAVHTHFILHNREAVTGGFLQPSSEFHKPIGTVFKSYAFLAMYYEWVLLLYFYCVSLNFQFFLYILCVFNVSSAVACAKARPCVCDCQAGNVEVSPGAVVALVTINGCPFVTHYIHNRCVCRF